MSALTVAIQPVVNWPRSAQAGKRYLVTVDVILAEPLEWPYDREEFVLGCVLEGGQTFNVEALGSTNLVLHRFGGTYGPVQFVVRPQRNLEANGSDKLRLTLVTEGGLPFHPIELPVLPHDVDTDSVVPGYTSWTMIAPTHQTPGRIQVSRPGMARSTPTANRAVRRTALLIGINGSGLTGPENDVAAIAAALELYGFSTVRISDSEATRSRIVTAYETIIADTGPNDAVFIFYSGHGGSFTVPSPEAPGRALSHSHLLVPFLEPNDYVDAEEFGGITSIEIAALLTQLTSKTRNVVVAYDCNGGGGPPRVVALPDSAPDHGIGPRASHQG